MKKENASCNDCYIDGYIYNDKLIIRIQLFTQMCISQNIKMMVLIVLNDLLSCSMYSLRII